MYQTVELEYFLNVMNLDKISEVIVCENIIWFHAEIVVEKNGRTFLEAMAGTVQPARAARCV